MPAASPIDDFLAETGTSTAAAERLEAIGLGLSLFGTLLAVGVVVVLLAVHRGPLPEIRRLLGLVVVGGLLMTVGGAIEAAGTARLVDARWWDTLIDGSAPSALLRAVGGLLVVIGVAVERAAGQRDADAAPIEGRWTPAWAHAFAINGVAMGVVSFSYDGHTVTEGPRLVHAALDAVHVTAGGIWFGGVVALSALALTRRHGIRSLLVRFAAIATFALAAVAVAGATMALLIVDGIGDLTGTPWGRRYLVKLGLVAVAALLGAHHHYRVVPRLLAGDTADAADVHGHPGVDASVRRTVVAEAVVLTAVVVTTALLVRASTS